MRSAPLPLALMLAILTVLVCQSCNGEIVMLTEENFEEKTKGRGVVLLVSSSLDFASSWFDLDAYGQMYDASVEDRLVGFVNCSASRGLCMEMGWFTNPTLRYGRPDALEGIQQQLRNFNNELDTLKEMVNDSMAYEVLHDAFSPSSLDITHGPSLADLSAEGRPAMVRYCASRLAECRRTQPDWERFATSSDMVVAEVDCGAYPDLPSEHEHFCSWSSGEFPTVLYAYNGYLGELDGPYSYKDDLNDSIKATRRFDYSSIQSLAQDFQDATRIDPLVLTSANWNTVITEGKSVLVFFSSPSCCGLQTEEGMGGCSVNPLENMEDYYIDDSYTYDVYDEISLENLDCQYYYLETVRLARKYPSQLIATVDCDEERELCERQSAYVLPRVLYGTAPYNVSFSEPLSRHYQWMEAPVRTADGNFATLLDLADTFMANDGPQEALNAQPGEQSVGDILFTSQGGGDRNLGIGVILAITWVVMLLVEISL